jgi:hypothetical protein
MIAIARPGAVALLVCCAVVLHGCGRSTAPERHAFSGIVNVNGEPLAAGRIRFMPRVGTEGPSASAGILAGRFAVEKPEGLIAGVYRVEIEALDDLGFALDDEAAFAKRGGKPLPPNPIPGKYNRNSSLTAAISSTSDNEFKFNLEVTDKPSNSKGS